MLKHDALCIVMHLTLCNCRGREDEHVCARHGKFSKGGGREQMEVKEKAK